MILNKYIKITRDKKRWYSNVKCDKCGKIREIRFDGLNSRKDHDCRECGKVYKNREKTIEKCNDIALARDLNILTRDIISASQEIEWQCKRGHIFKNSLTNMNFRKYCPFCYDKNIQKTLNDYLELAKSRNMEFLDIDKEIKTTETKYRWMCNCGEISITTYWNVIRTNSCLKCSVNLRNKDKHYRWNPDREYTIGMKKCRNIFSGFISEIVYNNGDKIHYKLGYSVKQLKNHIESQFTSGMSWQTYGKLKDWTEERRTWQIDHIIPRAIFARNNIDNPKIIDSFSNLRPLDSIKNQERNKILLKVLRSGNIPTPEEYYKLYCINEEL